MPRLQGTATSSIIAGLLSGLLSMDSFALPVAALGQSTLAHGASSASQSTTSPPPAQPTDPATLAGRFLRDPSRDDVMTVAVLARGWLAGARGTPAMTPAIGQLAMAAVGAYQQQDYPRAWRLATRLLALSRGDAWSDGFEAASSFDVRLSARLVEPGDDLSVSLVPLFTLDRPFSAGITAVLRVQQGGAQVADLGTVAVRESADQRLAVPTARLAPGAYVVEYELHDANGAVLARAARPFEVAAGVRQRLAALGRRLEVPAASTQGASATTARETAAFHVETYQRALREYVATAPVKAHPMTVALRSRPLAIAGDGFRLESDLVLASSLLDDVAAGRDPLAARRGDLHLAYRSDVDGTLQPFRVVVPPKYDGVTTVPMIVALHGATGDENTYVDQYVSRTDSALGFKAIGEARGYLLVSPNGRGAFGQYVGDSERDVLDVMDRVEALYRVDRAHVFLTGHSMGGAGTFDLGFKHAARFAAIAPVATQHTNFSKVPFDNRPDLPVLFSHGTTDQLAPIAVARTMAETAKSRLRDFTFTEYEGVDHFAIGVVTLPSIFDFFDRHRGPVGSPVK